MKKTGFIVVVAFAVLLAGGLLVTQPAAAKLKYVTIGTGGVTGVYYPTGGAISKMVNKKRKQYGIRATVESTGGSVVNVNGVMSGDLEFGIVQSDLHQVPLRLMADIRSVGLEDNGKTHALRGFDGLLLAHHKLLPRDGDVILVQEHLGLIL